MSGQGALRCLTVTALALLAVPLVHCDADETPMTAINKAGIEVYERSNGRMLADEVIATGNVVLADTLTPVPQLFSAPHIQLRGGNVQVNDPALDNIQIFPGFRPFVKFTQSET